LIGFVLLLTPTGSLPSQGWRWWARGMVAALVALLLVVTLAGGPLDPRYQAARGPFEFRGFSRVVMAANQVALAVTVLGVVVAAGPLVVRFRGARGVERLQLRWVAFAAVLVSLAGVVVLAGLALGATDLLTWAASVCVALLPVAIGAAILRYRLYDLDRIISRTLAYGVLTLLLGGGYAAVALGFGQLLGRRSSLRWPWRPWRWLRCSSRRAAASSGRSTGASTGAATTPPRRCMRSAVGCDSRSTWTP
jgi:hypothetical protein